jgi:acyl-CoA thioester hydrolase
MSVFLKSQKVTKDWVDYNGHMNMAYYVLIFDQAWEVALEKFKMGESAAKSEQRSTMVVETNTKYINEVKENEEVDINLIYFDHDKKRLHLKMEMNEKKTNKLSASMEWISLYIDLGKRKVTEFELDKIELMDNFIKENNSKFFNENLLFSSKLKKDS